MGCVFDYPKQFSICPILMERAVCKVARGWIEHHSPRAIAFPFPAVAIQTRAFSNRDFPLAIFSGVVGMGFWSALTLDMALDGTRGLSGSRSSAITTGGGGGHHRP
jgi:hypothetical protein